MSHTLIGIDIAINRSQGIRHIYGLAIQTYPGHEKNTQPGLPNDKAQSGFMPGESAQGGSPAAALG